MQMTNKRRGLMAVCAATLFLVTVSVADSFHRLAADEDGATSSIEKNQLLTGKGRGHGYGPGNGNGNSGPKDGSGYGPGDCTTQVIDLASQPLLAGHGNGGGNGGNGDGNGGNGDGNGGNGGQGNGGGNGPGDGTGTCPAS